VDLIYDQLRGVGNRSLRSLDRETQAHAVLSAHQIDDITLAEGADANFLVHLSLLSGGYLVEVDLLVRRGDLQIKLREELFVLNGALVELLAQASLADGLVSDIVELRDQQVVDVLL